MKSILATDVKTASQVRSIVRFSAPGFKFKVTKVSFQDLARGECFFITSNEWTPEIYNQVKKDLGYVKNAIISA